MKNKQGLLIGVYVMVIVLVGISVAYAALSTTLNIIWMVELVLLVLTFLPVVWMCGQETIQVQQNPTRK